MWYYLSLLKKYFNGILKRKSNLLLEVYTNQIHTELKCQLEQIIGMQEQVRKKELLSSKH